MRTELEALLEQAIGLDVGALGSGALARAVRERCSSCQIDEAVYLEHVRSSPRELQELIEAVVVPETWFGRDPDALDALTCVARERTSARPVCRLRLLSLPCATGEEAYSMAMALLDAGIPGQRFQIDAIDVSERTLAWAERATYGKSSFRGEDTRYLGRHFSAVDERHRIVDSVREQVSFRRGNLLTEALAPDAACYDIIFCRNLLIYFSRVLQRRALAVLEALLSDEGWLFVGSAETGALRDSGFAGVRLGNAFAFRKQRVLQPTQPPTRSSVRTHPTPPPAARRRRNRAGVTAPLRAPPAGPALPIAAPPAPSGLEEAQRLADRGQLSEAIGRCEAHIENHGPSAEVFHLLALLHDAEGRTERADACYRKALFLDPHHAEALLHFACLKERIGQFAGARLLRERAQRTRDPRGLDPT